MATTIFTGAKRALQNVPLATQTDLYRQHYQQRARRAANGSTLRSTVHRVTDAGGTVHRLMVLSSFSGGKTDLIVMNPSDARAALDYVKQLQQQ